MSKHSPGPWHVDRNDVWAPDGTGGRFCVAEVWGDTAEELTTNGRLIAAAPELLALVKAYRRAEASDLDADELIARIEGGE